MSKSEEFSITIDPGNVPQDATAMTEARGVIQIGNFRESFLANLIYWSADDYRRSWRESFAVLNREDPSTSCLVTSITEPETSNFIFCWPLYRIGEVVFVQNSLIFLEELEERFDAAAPWKSVSPRETTTEDGHRISEWRTTMTALRKFFTSQP
ncbi:hypothetical protein [Streptomyces sp. 6N223]|uniref:hypothetical protein n=1 Tax=Streptomyces sp. 6N223 TaxID=3457412 RepID=UPI003FD3BD2E